MCYSIDAQALWVCAFSNLENYTRNEKNDKKNYQRTKKQQRLRNMSVKIIIWSR